MLLVDSWLGVNDVVFYSGRGDQDVDGIGVLVLKPDLEGLRRAVEKAIAGP